jgi:hypothetical protein
MAARKRGTEPARTVTQDELSSIALEALSSASVLSRPHVKKALPRDYQSHASAVLEILRELAAAGRIERWQKGSAEWFFATDPMASLGKVSRAALAAGPLSPEALQQRLELETKVPKAYLQEWKKRALARGELFEIAAPATSAHPPKRQSKLLSIEPDLHGALKKALGEIEKAFVALEARGVSRERSARFLFEALGLSKGDSNRSNTPAPHTTLERNILEHSAQNEERAVFLRKLHSLTQERRAGALLLVSELRERTPLDKARFDRIALELAREGLVDLHYHDHAQSLDVAERDRLVRDDAGTHYVGIALRPTH